MKSFFLLGIVFGLAQTPSHAADKDLDLVEVAMGYLSRDDNANYVIHTKKTPTHEYYCCLLSEESAPAAASYAAQNLLANIIKSYYGCGVLHNAIHQGFVTTDRNFCATSNDTISSAQATLIMVRDSQITVAHLGDIRAIFIKHNTPLQLNGSHSLNNTAENSGPSIKAVTIPHGLSCLVIATAEFWRRRDIKRTTDFCTYYLEDLSIASLADLQHHAQALALGLINSVVLNCNEDKDKQIRVLVVLLKKGPQ